MMGSQRKTGHPFKVVNLLFIFAWFMLWIFASGLDAFADNDLPDRPDPIVLPDRPKYRAPFKGGHIELHIAPALDIWTEVEWQDGVGEWHRVDGWRGYATVQGVVRWFVAESNLNNGPFRWQLYLYEDGDYLATSAPFYLPAKNGDTVVIMLEAPALEAYVY